ncbi:MAG TPA: hypothetical protein VFA04_01820 [Bryobacteraceae bacterium]|nr:hypothetical protein [Bryobacteraceae bacterium]
MTFGEDELLAKYLLHRLGEQERDALRERLFTEPELFERLREVEADLIDALARGSLSTQDAEAVAEFVLTTGQEERLAFARALARQARTRAARPAPSSLPFWIAVAACIVLAAATALLFSANRRLKTNTAAPHASGTVLAFDVLPVTRGAGGIQSVRLSSAQLVNFRIFPEGFPRYIVSLRNSAGPVWSAEMPAQRVLQFVVPAEVLRPGRYQIAVRGERAGAAPELVADTDIDVTR